MGPLKPDETFLLEDFVLLEKYMTQVSAEKVKSKVKAMGLQESK